MKPWDPPEQRLYPVLDDLLASWASSVRLPFEGIRIVGSQWSPQSYATREFLSRNQIPYQWIDIEQDAPMRELVIAIAGDTSRLPVVLLPDGTLARRADELELAEKVGLQTPPTRPFYDVVIIGGGPAGLASAVYAASEGLQGAARRAERAWRPGGHQLDDRELPWFSVGRHRRRSRAARGGAGAAVRRRAARRAKASSAFAARIRTGSSGSPTAERCRVTRWCWRPAWRCASSKCRE